MAHYRALPQVSRPSTSRQSDQCGQLRLPRSRVSGACRRRIWWYRIAQQPIDDVLADLVSFAAGRGTQQQVLSITQVRVSRIIHDTVEQVWHAHYDPAMLQQWMLGPDGWTMPGCETTTEVGRADRYEWEPDDSSGEGSPGRFGFEGELLEFDPPRRAVTTERMIGMEGPGTRNELTLTPSHGGTLLSLVITYPSAELRDTVLDTGMVDGMETSYARLEDVLA